MRLEEQVYSEGVQVDHLQTLLSAAAQQEVELVFSIVEILGQEQF
jgi:hypothetical protein